MARFHVLPSSPLTVHFWLLGLDARRGDLCSLGYQRLPSEEGSSRYRRGPLTLHSAGLDLELAAGPLRWERRTHSFSLAGKPLDRATGLRWVRPFLLEHEAAIARRYGTQWRDQQLCSHKLPAPVRRNLGAWQEFLAGEHGLSALLWQPSEQGRSLVRYG
ncbi:hypothetical protein ACFP81_09430 [Deinococcus lacus]|uniref:Uncharacterized protein n=1 Tax=Deinococcus lacus TaxID=392561 RepID=A0ABW1YF32_9DEIO